MPLKKRMFRSNMMLLFLSLAALMGIILAVLLRMEDAVEVRFYQRGEELLPALLSDYGSPEGALGGLEEALHILFGEILTFFLPALAVIGAGAIAVILGLSSFFTRRMNRRVMEPLDELVRGAERIRDGNLREPIAYRGEAEFENVCRAFNDMQQRILENEEQRARDEKARTDMITGISHDLRTPLTSIQGYIKGVLDGVADTPPKKEAYLRTAWEAAGEMNVLLQKLFDFSRMESGQLPFHMVQADLAEFAAAYAARREASLDPGQVVFRLRREQELMPEIRMDVDQIRRVFDNLLENSLKYAGVQPVEIEIAIRAEKEPNPAKVILTWKDNGQGVPPEKLSRIFDRFYRCDESRSEKGSGVGLYVVKYIVERHGGQIEAQNEGGLKLILTFPAAGRGGENDVRTDEGGRLRKGD